MKISSIQALFLVIASFALLFVNSPYAEAQCSVPCTLIWNDEFDGNSLDDSKWEYQYGDGTGYGISGWGNNELQYYTDSQALVNSGLLTIRAEKLPSGTQIGGKDYILSLIHI